MASVQQNTSLTLLPSLWKIVPCKSYTIVSCVSVPTHFAQSGRKCPFVDVISIPYVIKYILAGQI